VENQLTSNRRIRSAPTHFKTPTGPRDYMQE
jgi:hypothetical protein